MIPSRWVPVLSKRVGDYELIVIADTPHVNWKR